MSKYTKEDILKSAQENGVEFIRLQFTDVFGIMKNVAITSSQLEKALDNECMFDGSSIDGFVRINESDMYLHPDYDTWTIFPWRKHQNAQTARLICSVYCADNKTPFLGDPRNVLQKVMDEAAEMVAALGIVEKAPIAKKAMPACNIVCISGEEMKSARSGYLSVQEAAYAKSEGGQLPADDFYYLP